MSRFPIDTHNPFVLRAPVEVLENSSNHPLLKETVLQLPFLSFCASEARRRACPVLDTGESSYDFVVPRIREDGVWMPAFAGMTFFIALSAIMTQSQVGRGGIFSFLQRSDKCSYYKYAA
jgi:hypothetical protein